MEMPLTLLPLPRAKSNSVRNLSQIDLECSKKFLIIAICTIICTFLYHVKVKKIFKWNAPRGYKPIDDHKTKDA